MVFSLTCCADTVTGYSYRLPVPGTDTSSLVSWETWAIIIYSLNNKELEVEPAAP